MLNPRIHADVAIRTTASLKFYSKQISLQFCVFTYFTCLPNHHCVCKVAEEFSNLSPVHQVADIQIIVIQLTLNLHQLLIVFSYFEAERKNYWR